jgi:hypothetical protein
VRLRLLRVADRSQAETIAARLKAGESFATVARVESADASAAQGGDLGSVRVGDLAEPLRSAAAALAPGEVSPVLDTPAGFRGVTAGSPRGLEPRRPEPAARLRQRGPAGLAASGPALYRERVLVQEVAEWAAYE